MLLKERVERLYSFRNGVAKIRLCKCWQLISVQLRGNQKYNRSCLLHFKYKIKPCYFRISNHIPVFATNSCSSTSKKEYNCSSENLISTMLCPLAILSQFTPSSLGGKIFTNFNQNKMTLQSFPSREIEATICLTPTSNSSDETVNDFQILSLFTQFKQKHFLSILHVNNIF